MLVDLIYPVVDKP